MGETGEVAPPTAFGLIVFDNDGLLVDSETLANTVLADLLTRAGAPHTPQECIERYVGSTLTRVRQLVLTGHGITLDDGFEDEYHATLLERFDTDLLAKPGAVELVAQLTTPFCVASSGSHDRIRRALTVVGLLHRFDGHVYSADDVPRGKPAPDLFLRAAAAEGVSPDRCVVVEDSPIGIAAANAAGMASFGIAGTVPADRLADATEGVFDSLADLIPLLVR